MEDKGFFLDNEFMRKFLKTFRYIRGVYINLSVNVKK